MSKHDNHKIDYTTTLTRLSVIKARKHTMQNIDFNDPLIQRFVLTEE